MSHDPAALGAVRKTLARLAPPGVRTGVFAVDDRHLTDLFDGERSSVRSAVPARQREFATGRALLRDLLGQRVEIPAQQRRPVLPEGWAGSLAHDGELAAAVIAPVEVSASLGLDLERTGPMTADEAALVLRTDEAGLDPRLVFVLKEATYKAWSGLGGGFLEFHDVRVQLHRDRFEAAVVGRAASFTGHWARAESRWVSLVVG